MDEKQLVTIGEASKEQIVTWKHSNRKVMAVEVIDGEEKHVAYFKRPSMQTMSAVTKIGKTDELQGAKVLFDNCFLGGSDAFKDDAVLFMEASKQLAVMMESCRASLKNL